MTHQEHAENIRDKLRKVERAHRRLGTAIADHHEALRCAAEECGSDIGITPQFGEPKPDPQ